MEKLAGLRRDEVLGKMVTGDVFGTLCRLKSSDAMTKFMIILNNAMDGQDTERFPFSFLDRQVCHTAPLSSPCAPPPPPTLPCAL